MRKLTYLVLTVAIGLLMTTFATIRPVSAVVDFVAYKGTAISDAEIDGTIGTEWNDAGNYTWVTIDPSGAAYQILTKHDETYLYIAIKFDADSLNPWLALQLGTTGCMDTDADVAIFGDDNLAADGYSDAYFTAGKNVVADDTQNGTGAMTIDSQTQLVTIELKKPLNSGDTAGKDIAWSVGNTYSLVIAWDSDGGGSSGGETGHTGGTTPTARTILINPNVIPEFSSLMFVVVLIAVLIPVILFTRKMIPKVSTSRKL